MINVQNASTCPAPRLTGSVIRLGQCIDQPYEIELTVENFCPNTTTIKDIATFSVSNVIKVTPIGNVALQSILLSWKATEKQVGLQSLCAIAVDRSVKRSYGHDK